MALLYSLRLAVFYCQCPCGAIKIHFFYVKVKLYIYQLFNYVNVDVADSLFFGAEDSIL